MSLTYLRNTFFLNIAFSICKSYGLGMCVKSPYARYNLLEVDFITFSRNYFM